MLEPPPPPKKKTENPRGTGRLTLCCDHSTEGPSHCMRTVEFLGEVEGKISGSNIEIATTKQTVDEIGVASFTLDARQCVSQLC